MDRTIVHRGLARRYQDGYIQLCNGEEYPEVAHTLMRASRRTFERYLKDQIPFLRGVRDLLEQIPKEPLFKEQVNWRIEREKLEELSYQIRENVGSSSNGNVSRPGVDLSLDACSSVLNKIRDYAAPRNIYEEIIFTFLYRIYASEFEGKVPNTPKHHTVISANDMALKLEDLRPCIEEKLHKFASHIAGNDDTKVPLSRRKTKLNVLADTLVDY